MVRLAIFISIILIGILGCTSTPSTPVPPLFKYHFDHAVPWDKLPPDTKERIWNLVAYHDCDGVNSERWDILLTWAEKWYPDMGYTPMGLYAMVSSDDSGLYKEVDEVKLWKYLDDWWMDECP